MDVFISAVGATWGLLMFLILKSPVEAPGLRMVVMVLVTVTAEIAIILTILVRMIITAMM